jgi:hypothetical protein
MSRMVLGLQTDLTYLDLSQFSCSSLARFDTTTRQLVSMIPDIPQTFTIATASRWTDRRGKSHHPRQWGKAMSGHVTRMIVNVIIANKSSPGLKKIELKLHAVADETFFILAESKLNVESLEYFYFGRSGGNNMRLPNLTALIRNLPVSTKWNLDVESLLLFWDSASFKDFVAALQRNPPLYLFLILSKHLQCGCFKWRKA